MMSSLKTYYNINVLFKLLVKSSPLGVIIAWSKWAGKEAPTDDNGHVGLMLRQWLAENIALLDTTKGKDKRPSLLTHSTSLVAFSQIGIH